MDAIDAQLEIESVTLAVADLGRSSDFYERVLGLPLIERDGRSARLGADASRPALVLQALEAPSPAPARSTGLFHVAWLHPSRAALAETVRRIAAAGWPITGASDHEVSEALYLDDPDGLGIEVYADRPRERWRRGPGNHGVNIVTLPLDIEDLLAQAPAATPALAQGTRVGHVHLKVSDVMRATDFYVGTLGFEEQAAMPSAAFVSAGGYHHHLGLNSWQSAGAGPAPGSAPGLRDVRFRLTGPDELHALERRLDGAAAEHDGDAALAVSGPDGEHLTFTAGQRAAAG